MLAILKRRIALARAYRNVFASPGPPGDAQLVLHDILREGGILSTSVEPGLTKFNEGKRALALYILARLRWKEGDAVRLAEAQDQGDDNA